MSQLITSKTEHYQRNYEKMATVIQFLKEESYTNMSLSSRQARFDLGAHRFRADAKHSGRQRRLSGVRSLPR